MVLKYGLAQQRSFWKFYQIIRRLFNEGYIKEVSDSKTGVSLWTLTRKGFLYLDDGSMELVQKRFQPQALLHDYWSMVFQLGEFLLGVPSHIQLVSEQEFTAKEIADLPSWVPKTREHIPDGLTKVKRATSSYVVAFEVELSTKSDSRYEEMIRYLDQKEEINWVFWLCANEQIIQKITQQIMAVRRRRANMHNFVLLNDVRIHGWSAPFLWGDLINKSPSHVLGQYLGEHATNIALTKPQPALMAIYLAKEKSPRKFKGLAASVDPLKVLTP